MTTRGRIIIGCILLTMMALSLAFFSYNSSKQSSDNLKSYINLDKADTITFQIEIDLSQLTYRLSQFLLHHKTEDRQLAIQAAQNVLDYYKDLLNLVGTGNAAAQVRNTITKQETLMRNLQQLLDNGASLYQRYLTSFVPAQEAFQKELSDLLEYAFEIDNIDLAQDLVQSQTSAVLLAENTISFFLSLDSDYMNAVNNMQEALSASMARMADQKGNLPFAALKDVEEVEALYAHFSKQSMELEESALILEKQFQQLTDQRRSISEDTIMMSRNATEGATKELTTVVTRTNDNVDQSFFISVLVLLISLAITAYIVVSLSNTLKKMRNYAQHLALGEFDFDPQINEKGDIGQVVESMKAISVVLNQLTVLCQKTANEVSSGVFDSQMDVTTFKGSYYELTSTINTILASFTTQINNLPVGLFTGKQDNSIVYMNKAAKKMLGEEHVVGKSCGNLFLSPACNNPATCLGKQALSQQKALHGETTCQPKGTHFAISVAATPLFDLNKKPAGYMEVIIDITETKKQSQLIQEVSVQANDVALRVTAATEELAAQTEHIVQGSNFQRERIESTSTAMTEMNASVVEVARNAENTADQSALVRQKASDGIKLLVHMTESMEALQTSSEKLKNNMAQLDGLAEGIDSIINVISDIADQTNLLALNAAIEAARAGEAGRGFAVVADEVRKLAEKTMNATREVDESIRAIQNSSRANQQEVGSVVEHIVRTAELAQESEASLQEIVTFTEETSEMIQNIASAATQQETVSNEISQSMNDINYTVGQTSEAIMQSAEAIRELASQAQELQECIQRTK